MRDVNGYNMAEVNEKIEKQNSTASTRLSRARDGLHKKIMESENNNEKK
ncbi:MAG: hypothetical protein J5984_04640 [Clostridia bacterium]|nr:hypothetical protein [Clostridia bacterium]